MGIANITIAGNLTRDAEVREGNDGNQFVTFSVAVNQYAGEGNEEHVSFFDCSVNRPGLAPYLTKGQAVVCAGEMRQRRWEDADGTKRSAFSLRVRDFEFGSKKGDSTPEPAGDPNDLPF